MDLHNSSLCRSRVNCTLQGQVQRDSFHCCGQLSVFLVKVLETTQPPESWVTVPKMEGSQKISKHPIGGIATQEILKELGNGDIQTRPGKPQGLPTALHLRQSCLLAPGQPSVTSVQRSDDLTPPLRCLSVDPGPMTLWNVTFFQSHCSVTEVHHPGSFLL